MKRSMTWLERQMSKVSHLRSYYGNKFYPNDKQSATPGYCAGKKIVMYSIKHPTFCGACVCPHCGGQYDKQESSYDLEHMLDLNAGVIAVDYQCKDCKKDWRVMAQLGVNGALIMYSKEV